MSESTLHQSPNTDPSSELTEYNVSSRLNYIRRMRWFFLALVALWILAVIILPVVIFLITKNPTALYFFGALVPPIFVLAQTIKYLFPRTDEENKLGALRRQRSIRRQPIVVGSTTSRSTSNISPGKHWRQDGVKTLIIIPTYNECENLRLLLGEIFSYAPKTDVLIVDDNSPDGTGKLADDVHDENPQVHVLHRAGKLGIATAYIAGFLYALEHGYEVVFEMDADFSHDPRYLPHFLNAIEQADLVIGSRHIPGGDTPNWSIMRRLISGGGNIFARHMLGIPVHDCTAGYRCYRRHVLESIDLDNIESRGYAFQVEMAYRVMVRGFKIIETPIIFMDRRVGRSKMSRKNVIESFTYVLRTRFSKQSRLHAPVQPIHDILYTYVQYKPRQEIIDTYESQLLH